MAELSVGDVLHEMDEVANKQIVCGTSSSQVASWLKVLRPWLTGAHDPSWMPSAQETTERMLREQGLVERWPVVSSLPVSQLRDMQVKAQLDVDHEGGGTIEINYGQVPEQHRLQALIQMMAAISLRIELAVGTESFINMLRGRADRLERGR